jgi:hypothetical protein
MHKSMISKPNDSDTTCRIGPPADPRFDDEAFLLREMAEAKAALGRTFGAIKNHASHEMKPQRLLRRHPLETAGAVGLGGLLLVRRIFRSKSSRGHTHEQPAAAAPKAGLIAMLVPSVVAIVQSLTAAKMTNAQQGGAPGSPQAWMARTLWGMARDRFRNRAAPPPPPNTANPEEGLKAVGSRNPAPEPLRPRPLPRRLRRR